MTLARLLATALLVCSALAFAQKKSDSLAIPAQAADASKSPTAAPSERGSSSRTSLWMPPLEEIL